MFNSQGSGPLTITGPPPLHPPASIYLKDHIPGISVFSVSVYIESAVGETQK